MLRRMHVHNTQQYLEGIFHKIFKQVVAERQEYNTVDAV